MYSNKACYSINLIQLINLWLRCWLVSRSQDQNKAWNIVWILKLMWIVMDLTWIVKASGGKTFGFWLQNSFNLLDKIKWKLIIIFGKYIIKSFTTFCNMSTLSSLSFSILSSRQNTKKWTVFDAKMAWTKGSQEWVFMVKIQVLAHLRVLRRW